MIGSITWERGGALTTVTLDERGRWECPADPSAAVLVDVLFGDELQAYSPAHGAYGAAVLNRAAAHLGGTVEFEPKIPDPPGTVY